MKQYPGRLHHKTPAGVSDGAIYHVRIRCAKDNPVSLTNREIDPRLLTYAESYARQGRWACYLMVLMPDHVHALLGFDRNRGMSETIRNWKRGNTRTLGIHWQDNYFDHRIRNAAEYSEKVAYIQRNPVVLGLCERPEEWPHQIVCIALESVPHF